MDLYHFVLLLEHLTVSISVDYSPPTGFTPGPNEYRAASGPVTVTCTATGPGTGVISYQWSSTCRSCPFQSATTSSISRPAVHSGDTGTHTCVATRGGGTANASIDFRVVGKYPVATKVHIRPEGTEHSGILATCLTISKPTMNESC